MKISDKKQLIKLLSYIIMGDGGVYVSGKCVNASFSMNMVEDNRDFVEYCAGVISNITSTTITNVDKGDGRKPQLRLQSKVHPEFTRLRDRIYTGTYKGIDPHALKLLDFEALAILYMCDGSLHTELPQEGRRLVNPSHNVVISLNRLSYGDLYILKKAIKEKLDLEFNINRKGKYYSLRLRTKDVGKFMDGIKPHMFDSFSYKLV